MALFNVGFISVVPSPYQRDLFCALAARPDVHLRVYYLEASAPDSPWPQVPLQPYETVLPGFWFSVGGARFHVTSRMPSLGDHEFVVVNSLTSTLGQWLLRFGRKRPRLLFWAEALRDQSGPLRARVQRFLSSPIRKADAIVAIGSRAQEAYQRRFGGMRCFNVPYHCDLEAFFARPAQFDRLPDEIVFLFCGQLIARKGVDILLEAFDWLVRSGHRIRLRLAGRRAELDEMLARVSAATRERISYAGFVDPKQLPELFSGAHAFVLPSRYDGWGVVVNQALGAGLPVICSTAVGAGVDLVRPGLNGIRFAAGDSHALAGAMEQFIAQPHLLREYGAASRKLAVDWTPDRGGEKWISVFSELQCAR
ncbi:MAG: glycosyltransferase family 4 protein [Verrucomicrobia bacterium]|nr:glycosyltransferase family 4 protein [Verrucomicrobiota bacterium]